MHDGLFWMIALLTPLNRFFASCQMYGAQMEKTYKRVATNNDDRCHPHGWFEEQ